MAEFGVEATGLSAPQAAGSTPVGGWGASEMRTDIWADLRDKGQLVGAGIASTVGNKANPILAEYQKKVDPIVAARNAGTLSGAEAGARIRAVNATALAQAGGNPEVAEAINKLARINLELQDNTVERTAEKQQQELDFSIKRELNEMGIPTLMDSSDRSLEATRSLYYGIKSAERDFSARSAALNYAVSNYDYDQKLLKDGLASETQSFIEDLLPKASDDLQATAADLREKVLLGKAGGGLDEAEARNFLKSKVAGLKGQLVTIKGFNPDAVNAVNTYLDEMADTYDQMLDPTFTERNVEAVYNTQLIKDKNFVRLFPNMRAFQALQSLAPNNPFLINQMNTEAMDIFSTVALGITDQNAPNIGNMSPESKKQLFSVTKGAIKNVVSSLGNLQEGQGALGAQTTDNVVNGLLSSFANHSGAIPSAQSAEMVGFLASKEFKTWRERGNLSPEALEGAQRVFDNQYLRKVQKPIDDVLAKPIPGLPPTISSGATNKKLTYKDVFNVEFKDGLVKFIPKEVFGDAFQQDQAKDFRENLTKSEQTINHLIRAGANVAGVDANTYWENNKGSILPSYYPPRKVDVGDVVDGYEYLGGDVNSPNSWRASNAGEQ